MTSTAATSGIKDVLSNLEDDQLFGLARTITQGLAKGTLTNRQDAMDVILKYSPNEVSILRRRAITRDVLFAYLHKQNIKVNLPTTKDKLIDQICASWKILNQEIQPTESEQTAVTIEDSADSVVSMARQFSEWFFEMMNRDEMLDVSHFFPDVAVAVTMTSDESTWSEDTCLPEDVTKLLYRVKKENRLRFNPNLNSEGVRGVVDPHGLVIVLACGTLHVDGTCIGVFDQMFSLARDLTCENNWKIKMTKLNLRSRPVTKEPTLGETNFCKALVCVKSED